MYDMLNSTIGYTIAELLESQGKKQKDLAKYLEVNSNVVSYWCNGTRKPNIEQIIQIAKYFNVTTDYLLGVSQNKTTDIELAAVSEYVKLKDETVKTLHSGCSLAPKFLDFVLSPENSETFNDLCYIFNRYCDAIDDFHIAKLDFIRETPPISSKEVINQFMDKFKQLEEKIDYKEYKVEKEFSLLLYMCKTANSLIHNQEIEKEFQNKWSKFIIKCDKKFNK